MLANKTAKDVQLYAPNGELIQSQKTTPEFDPNFLKSFTTLMAEADKSALAARFPYKGNPWVYACSQAITKNIKYLEPVLFDKSDPKNIIRDHVALELLEEPCPNTTSDEFFELILLHLLLPTAVTEGGQCFVLATDEGGEFVNLVRGEIPYFLWPFSDVFIRAKVVNNKFMGWEWTKPNNEREIVPPESIIRIRLVNPDSLWLGQSPYAALRASAVKDAKAVALADRFLDNNATVGTYITTDQELREEKLKRLKGFIREQYEGPQNAGKTMLLHSGLKLDAVAKSMPELEFSEQRQFTREEIMAAYGVGKLQLKLTDDINRATAEVDTEEFWQQTLMPYIFKIWRGGFNPQWIRYIDKRNKRGMFDVTNVQALRRDQNGKIDRADKLINQGVPANTAYDTVGLNIDTEGMEWLDKPWVKGIRTNMETGEVVGRPAPAVNPEPAQAPVEPVKSIIHVKDDMLRYWLKVNEATQARPEKDYKKMIIKFWNEQRNAFLDQVDAWKDANAKSFHQKASVRDFMIAKGPEDKKLITRSQPIYTETIALQAIQLETELGQLTQWDSSGPAVTRIRRARDKWLKSLNTVTFKTMGKEIRKILDENVGESVSKIAKLIKEAERKTMGARIASSNQTVARTETSAVNSSARTEIMKEEGIEKHSWVTAGDELVRETHSAEQGNIVKMGEPFPVTGLIYPLADGPAEEVINCRCTTVPEK